MSGGRIVGITLLLLWGIQMGGEALAQSSGDLMHRRHSIDPLGPLVVLFEDMVVATKKGDWESIGKRIEEIGGRAAEYKRNFGIDMMPRIQKAAAAKNAGETLKLLAQVIYLDMRAQFKAIVASKLDNFLDAKERLDLAKEYYTAVLSGNVIRKAPERAEKIDAGFLAAQAALGNPGFYVDLPPAPPDLKGFEAASKTIETEIASVYTYFKE